MNDRELKERRRYLKRSRAMVSEWLGAIADTQSLQKRLTRLGFIGAAYHTGVAVHYLLYGGPGTHFVIFFLVFLASVLLSIKYFSPVRRSG
jgi:hypothetical protein